ncbi:MAG: LptA/OstA family protein [Pseudomonadota bacterium]
MRTYLSYSVLLLPLLCLPHIASAADETADTPLEITANTALEWDQNAKTYVARGNALAKQNDMSLQADLLTAYYDDTKANTITKLVAEGHVTITSGTDKATADKAVYDIQKGQGDLTGGRPQIIRANNDMLEADSITIWTQKTDGTAKGASLNRAEAIGTAIITNGIQRVSGDKVVFSSVTNTAEIFGHVKIEQDKNWLSGDYADMNLTTHISHVKTSGSTQQVKGVFFTKSAASPKPAKDTTKHD